MKDLPVRKNIRLKDYDYSREGCYFITICVKDRHELLGKVVVGAALGRPQMCLSNYGEIVQSWIHKISDKYPSVCIQNYVIMPNHIHMIVSIQRATGFPDAANGRPEPPLQLVKLSVISNIKQQRLLILWAFGNEPTTITLSETRPNIKRSGNI